jgi:hypothetical protein
LAWLLVLPDRNFPKQKELVEVDKLCAALPVLPQCRDLGTFAANFLVISFQDSLRRRAKDELDGWLETVVDSLHRKRGRATIPEEGQLILKEDWNLVTFERQACRGW